MKVDSTWGPGHSAASVAAACATLVVAMLAGAGFLSSQSASAYVVEPAIGAEARLLTPVDERAKADEIRQPSGLETAQVAAARTPTTVRRTPRPARVAGAASTAVVPSDGWRAARVSWYGPGFIGHTMAGGGTLQWGSMVVAHRSLPFGTLIEFRYNGNACTAVVMDRGPYAGGRSFDLGPGTAAALGFSGVGTVEYRIVSH